MCNVIRTIFIVNNIDDKVKSKIVNIVNVVFNYKCKYKINEYLYKSFRDKRDIN